MSDYVSPAAMSSWRKRRLSQINGHASTQLHRQVLATFVIIGEPGTKVATHLGQNFDNISPHHRRFLRVSPTGMYIDTIRLLRHQADVVAPRVEAC